jgi:hypothetical protein
MMIGYFNFIIFFIIYNLTINFNLIALGKLLQNLAISLDILMTILKETKNGLNC